MAVRTPRARVILPIAAAMALLAPLLRALPGGSFLPDPLLLLLLAIIPLHFSPADGAALRRAILWIFTLGTLRVALSAVSPFTAWAGMGLGLWLRALAHRHLADHRAPARFAVGAAAALPLALLDAYAARRLGLAAPWPALAGQIAGVGILAMLVLKPPRYPAQDAEPTPSSALYPEAEGFPA